MSQRIAVIGSNSFSGASFVRHCLLQGMDVLGASRSDEPAPCFLPYAWLPAEPRSRFRFVRADLNHDLDRLMAELSEHRPEMVVNFAAQGMVAQSWQVPEHWYQTNVVANVRLHDRLRRCPWLGKYVHVSTPEVYGSTDHPIDETAPFNPSTPYAASRAACDLHLRTFLAQHRFPVVWTRAANIYGPGQQLYRIVPRTVLAVRLCRPLRLEGGGRSVRSFIHADDVADATLRIARSAPAGECYHLATERTLSIRQLVEAVCRQLGADFDAVVQVGEDRAGKDAAYLLDSSKVRGTLGWRDRTGLDDGIAGVVAWFDRHLDEIRGQPAEYVHKP
ncbi:MAG TPA: GDP-mannose 4,6-dehydratase [Opitutaceae bacterium]|jgi:dTDP-glucose 4,6-dehydratase